MSSQSKYFLSNFSSLRQIAAQQKYRYGVVLEGQELWNKQVCQRWIASLPSSTVFQLGGEPLSTTRYATFKQGQQLLGQECELLICDFSDGWDANSFSAALGTVVGGGIVVILGFSADVDNHADQWMQRALKQLISLSENSSFELPSVCCESSEIDFSQQQLAIENIVRVVEGHRKRPLVLTADRGRGKSSSLGLAAAKLMKQRDINILVTAPNLSAVKPVFQFAEHSLDDAIVKRGCVETPSSSLRFIAPDELLLQRPECDLLLVDEAASIPLPMLEAMVENYHRTVFSSTINGYEGCGRGFTLKFQHWLKSVRSGCRFQNISQPIRWNLGDPLEAWHRDSFLLDFDFESIEQNINTSNIEYRSVDKDELVAKPELTHHIFSLLVNAHYQTSPNDLFHLLSDPSINVHIATGGGRVVACILSVAEGKLDDDLIEAIQNGERRPRGHLTPVTLANQLGIAIAAKQSSTRIMRIAVHPDLQNMGVGAHFVDWFIGQHACDYVSTCFGATASLVKFWQMCGFQAVKIGSQRDQSSGCYSLVMVKGEALEWLVGATTHFFTHFVHELSDSLKLIEFDLVKVLLAQSQFSNPSLPLQLLEQYSCGGANYESIAVWLHQFLLSLPSDHFNHVSDLMMGKVLLRMSWTQCAHQFHLTGRKQIENTMKRELAVLMSNLHCKAT